MTIELLDKMKETKKAKINGKVEKYGKLKHEVQRLCEKNQRKILSRKMQSWKI